MTAYNPHFMCFDVGRYEHLPNVDFDESAATTPEEEKRDFDREVPSLYHDDQLARRCPVAVAPPGYWRVAGSELSPVLVYQELPFLPFVGTSQKFLAEESPSGQIEWIPEGRNVRVYGYTYNASKKGMEAGPPTDRLQNALWDAYKSHKPLCIQDNDVC